MATRVPSVPFVDGVPAELLDWLHLVRVRIDQAVGAGGSSSDVFDTSFTGLADLDYLRYDASSLAWVNITLKDIADHFGITNNTIPKYTTAGGLVNSLISDNGVTVSVNGGLYVEQTLDVNTADIYLDTGYALREASNLYHAYIPRPAADQSLLRSPGNLTIQIDADNNSSANVFSIRHNASTYSGGSLLFAVNESGQMTLPNGSESAPAYSFDGKTGYGMYSDAANYLSFAVNGSEIFRISDLHTDASRATLNRALIIIHSNGQSSSWEISRNAGAAGGGGWKAALDAGVPVVSGDRLGFYLFSGADDSDTATLPKNVAGIEAYATENFVATTNYGTEMRFYTHPKATAFGRVLRGKILDDGSWIVGTDPAQTSFLLRVGGEIECTDYLYVSDATYCGIQAEVTASAGAGSEAYLQTWGSGASGFVFHRGVGTKASPSAVTANAWLGYMDFAGYASATNDWVTGFRTRVRATSLWSDTNYGTKVEWMTNADGESYAPASLPIRMMIASDGGIVIGPTDPGSMSGYNTQILRTKGGARLTQAADSEFVGLVVEHTNDSSGSYAGLEAIDYGTGVPYLALVNSRGSKSTPSAVQSGDYLGAIDFLGYGTAINQFGAEIGVYANENWSGTNRGAKMVFALNEDAATSQTDVITIKGDNTGFPAGTRHRVSILNPGDPRSFNPTLNVEGGIQATHDINASLYMSVVMENDSGGNWGGYIAYDYGAGVGYFDGRRARGTKTSPTAVQANDMLTALYGAGSTTQRTTTSVGLQASSSTPARTSVAPIRAATSGSPLRRSRQRTKPSGSASTATTSSCRVA